MASQPLGPLFVVWIVFFYFLNEVRSRFDATFGTNERLTYNANCDYSVNSLVARVGIPAVYGIFVFSLFVMLRCRERKTRGVAVLLVLCFYMYLVYGAKYFLRHDWTTMLFYNPFIMYPMFVIVYLIFISQVYCE